MNSTFRLRFFSQSSFFKSNWEFKYSCRISNQTETQVFYVVMINILDLQPISFEHMVECLELCFNLDVKAILSNCHSFPSSVIISDESMFFNACKGIPFNTVYTICKTTVCTSRIRGFENIYEISCQYTSKDNY